MVGAHVQSPIAISYGDALFVDHVPALQYHGYWPSASRSRSTVKVTGATDASDSVEPHAHDVVPYVRVADQLSDSKSNTAESSAWLRATVTSKISPANATISGGHALCSLENTGQSALLRFECLQRERMPFVRGGMLPQQNRYIFEQLHFHWAAGDALGSEHMIEHQKYVYKLVIFFFRCSRQGEANNTFAFPPSMGGRLSKVALDFERKGIRWRRILCTTMPPTAASTRPPITPTDWSWWRFSCRQAAHTIARTLAQSRIN